MTSKRGLVLAGNREVESGGRRALAEIVQPLEQVLLESRARPGRIAVEGEEALGAMCQSETWGSTRSSGEDPGPVSRSTLQACIGVLSSKLFELR